MILRRKLDFCHNYHMVKKYKLGKTLQLVNENTILKRYHPVGGGLFLGSSRLCEHFCRLNLA